MNVICKGFFLGSFNIRFWIDVFSFYIKSILFESHRENYIVIISMPGFYSFENEKFFKRSNQKQIQLLTRKMFFWES